jgi:hypothetical protein
MDVPVLPGEPMPKTKAPAKNARPAVLPTPAGMTRRLLLLLPLGVAACGSTPEPVYEPLRYNYLPPIQLDVTAIDIAQRFIPSGVPPDVSGQDPIPPIEALKSMANDRLQAFGTANKAVFAIQDASLIREGDTLAGSFIVSLVIQADNGGQLGFAEARVQNRRTARFDDIRPVLYDMTKAMMSDMNVEFEYQIRRNLKQWLTNAAVPDTPVDQAPLDKSTAEPAPAVQPSPDQSPPPQ